MGVTDVFETHIHNDYITGGLALAQATGARYHVNAEEQVSFERTPIRDGEVVEVGSMTVRAIATPGHTFTHLSYALEGETPAVFTGGSLLFGSTGRPDLLGPEHAEGLARHQHASAHRLAEELPDDTQVMPTHGFGSFCSATQSAGDSFTIGTEKTQNPALTTDAEEYILDGLDVYPRSTPTWLRPTPPGRTPPTCPPPRAPTSPSCAAGSRRGSGSSTYAPAQPPPPATPQGRSASGSTASWPPTLAG